MTPHTPGPWMLGESGVTVFGRSDWIAGDEVIQRVAICNSDGLYHSRSTERQLIHEAEANARLIAAAPDLLALARYVLRVRDEAGLVDHPAWVSICDRADAIIAQVEGREIERST